MVKLVVAIVLVRCAVRLTPVEADLSCRRWPAMVVLDCGCGMAIIGGVKAIAAVVVVITTKTKEEGGLVLLA